MYISRRYLLGGIDTGPRVSEWHVLCICRSSGLLLKTREYPHLIVLIRDMRAPTHIGTGGRWNIQDVYTAYVVDVTNKYYSFRAMSSY